MFGILSAFQKFAEIAFVEIVGPVIFACVKLTFVFKYSHKLIHRICLPLKGGGRPVKVDEYAFVGNVILPKTIAITGKSV